MFAIRITVYLLLLYLWTFPRFSKRRRVGGFALHAAIHPNSVGVLNKISGPSGVNVGLKDELAIRMSILQPFDFLAR